MSDDHLNYNEAVCVICCNSFSETKEDQNKAKGEHYDGRLNVQTATQKKQFTMETNPRRRKVKNRILHLTELMPEVTFQTIAQYGVGDNSMYVMSTEVNSKEFFGIGPSKKRAKAMAADYALVDLGVLDEMEELPPDIFEWVDDPADFTADIVDNKHTQLYYDFDAPEVEPDAQESEFFDDDDEDEEDDPLLTIDEATMQMLGKNPLTILGEMRLTMRYTLLDESGDPLHPRFLIELQIDEHTFRGGGSSKKLAKGRAARDALAKLYNLEFGTSENGMPIYEGDARLWQHYKAKLEKRAERRLNANRDPVKVLQEYFPEIRYTYINPPKKPGDVGRQHLMRIEIFDEVYESFGSDKAEAKKNVSAKTLHALKQSGVIAAREREMEADRKASVVIQPKIPSLLDIDKKSIPVQRNAVAKLNIAYPNSEYVLVAETPVENTLLTAFTMAVKIGDRSFVGVGKTKKTAKTEAAEKALRCHGLWNADDEAAKQMALAEDVDPVASVSRFRENFEAKKMRSQFSEPFLGGPGGPEGWGEPFGPPVGDWGGYPMGPGNWNDGPPQWGDPRGPFPNDFDFRDKMMGPPGFDDDMGPRGFDDMGPRGFDNMGPRGFDDMGPRGFNGMGPRGFNDRGPRGRDFEPIGPDSRPFGFNNDMGPRGFKNLGPRGFNNDGRPHNNGKPGGRGGSFNGSNFTRATKPPPPPPQPSPGQTAPISGKNSFSAKLDKGKPESSTGRSETNEKWEKLEASKQPSVSSKPPSRFPTPLPSGNSTVKPLSGALSSLVNRNLDGKGSQLDSSYQQPKSILKNSSTTFGSSVGSPFGSTVGSSYGANMGLSYGAPVGSSFGAPVGSSFGAPVGSPYGASVGLSFGSNIGSPYGATVGSSYGASTYGAPAGPSAETNTSRQVQTTDSSSQPYSSAVGQSSAMSSSFAGTHLHGGTSSYFTPTTSSNVNAFASGSSYGAGYFDGTYGQMYGYPSGFVNQYGSGVSTTADYYSSYEYGSSAPTGGN